MATTDEPHPATDGPAADRDRINWMESADLDELERLLFRWRHAPKGRPLRPVIDELRRESRRGTRP